MRSAGQGSGFGRRHAVDPGLAAGDQQVRHVLARGGPVRDRGGGAVLQIVGVGDDAQRAHPVVGEGFHDLLESGSQNFAVSNTARTRSSKCSRGSVS